MTGRIQGGITVSSELHITGSQGPAVEPIRRSAHYLRSGLMPRRAASAMAAILFATPAICEAQESINQPLSDEFGVERKTGRASFPLPELLRIGGDGASSLKLSFTHIDGSGIAQASWPTVTTNEVIPPPNATDPRYRRYLKASISYGDISENFRKLYDPVTGYTAGSWEAEYPTGSTYDGTIFTDKHGLRITFGLITVVERPDGVTHYFDAPNGSVRNNFGYAIKGQNNLVANGSTGFKFGTLEYQAVNLATDYCNMGSQSLCSGLSGERGATYEAVQSASGYAFPERFILTDAVGGVTTIRNQLFSAYAWRPRCGNLSCDVPPLHYRPYPVGLTRPGSSTETHTMRYVADIQPGTVGYSHDDIRIDRVVLDGVTVDYEPNFFQPGAAYGSTDGASWYRLRSLIGGQEISYSDSFKRSEFWGDSRRVLTLYRDELGRETFYSFDGLFEVAGVTYPEGNTAGTTKDARGNIVSVTFGAKPGFTDPDQQLLYSYAPSCTMATQAKCNRPLSATDARGQVTDFEYNDRGQVTVERRPAPVPGAPRPTVTSTYTLRTAYIKDAGGNPVAAGPPVSMLTRTSSCISQASCVGTVDEVVTEYDYGPTTGLNNLLLRGIAVTAVNDQGQMQTLRTCYQYNYFGEKIAETQPGAGLTSCP